MRVLVFTICIYQYLLVSILLVLILLSILNKLYAKVVVTEIQCRSRLIDNSITLLHQKMFS